MMKQYSRDSLRLIYVCALMLLSSLIFAKSDTSLKVGVYQNPPLVSVTETGKAGGIFVDLMNAIAKKENLNIEYVSGSWADLLSKTKSGEIDFITSIAYTAEREKLLDYSAPVITMWGSVYTQKGSSLISINDLNNKRVGYLNHGINSEKFFKYAHQFNLNIRYHAFPSYSDALQALVENQVDAVVVNSIYGFYSAKQMPIQETGIQFSPLKLHFATKKNSHTSVLATISKHLESWRKASESPYRDTIGKWLSINVAETELPKWLLPLIYILLFFVVLGGIFIIVLRRMVNVKNRQYQNEADSRILKEKEVYKLREQMELFTQSLPDPGFILDRNGFVHAVYCDQPDKLIRPELMLLSPEELQQINVKDIMPADEQYQLMMNTIRLVLEKDSPQQIVEYPISIEGRDRVIEARVNRIDKDRVIWLTRDITQNVELKNRIMRMEMYDADTGLANRALLSDRLSQAIALTKLKHQVSALIFIDLDDFQQINDQHGHSVGDEVLFHVASMLKNIIRESDTIARLGGDEFAILLNLLDSPEEALNIIGQIQLGLAGEKSLSEYGVSISASFGIAFWRPGLTQTIWMKHADLALSEAKRKGKNGFHLFSIQLNERFDKEAGLLEKLKLAVAHQQFFMVYQPQYSADGKEIIGLEALLRWKEGSQFISPADFIPVAERHNLIAEITWMTVSWVCEAISSWVAEGICPPKVAINMSTVVMKNEPWADIILENIRRVDIPPDRLEIEITEASLIKDFDATLVSMQTLKVHGIHFSIDDFGTGYSSMQYLERLPVDKLKIDQGFIRRKDNKGTNQAIVQSIISLAHALGMTAIAEGVETEEQLAQLRSHGCDEIQGYIWSKPLKTKDLEILLHQQSGHDSSSENEA